MKQPLTLSSPRMKELLNEFKEHEKKFVRVFNSKGQRLDNCTPKRARILLERGTAIVRQQEPFTIELQEQNGADFELEIRIYPETSHLVLSELGQNRTQFLLEKAIDIAQDIEVLFISTIVNNTTLNKMAEHVSKQVGKTNNIKLINSDTFDYKLIENELPNHNFSLIVIDEIDDLNILTTIKNNFSLSLLVGGSVEKSISSYALIPSFNEKEELSSITSLNAAQLRILKNRYGSSLENKAKNASNITYAFIQKNSFQ